MSGIKQDKHFTPWEMVKFTEVSFMEKNNKFVRARFTIGHKCESSKFAYVISLWSKQTEELSKKSFLEFVKYEGHEIGFMSY